MVTESVAMEIQQRAQYLVSYGEEEGVVGTRVPLTRPYHLVSANKAPELGGWVDLPPPSQTQLDNTGGGVSLKLG